LLCCPLAETLALELEHRIALGHHDRERLDELKSWHTCSSQLRGLLDHHPGAERVLDFGQVLWLQRDDGLASLKTLLQHRAQPGVASCIVTLRLAEHLTSSSSCAW
jgi:hypothetical protein